MPIGGLCPSCGYADIMFPNTVPQSIADFEARRLESHRNIADRLKKETRSADGPRTMLVIRGAMGEVSTYPIEEGLNTYGSRPDKGIPHVISIPGLQLAPMHFVVKLTGDEVRIQPAPNIDMYLHGRRLEKACDARCRTFAIKGAEITVIKI